MKLAISQIGWEPAENAAALELLGKLGVRCIEGVPGRLWTGECKEPLLPEGFEMVALQAILFGRPDLVIFGESRDELISHLTALASKAAAAGVKVLVFGAPKNRLFPAGMPPLKAREIGCLFFSQLAEAAVKAGVVFTLEPNPAEYGGNWLTHMSEAASVVRAVDSIGLRLQLDAGELAMNAERVEEIVADNIDLVGHVHISQPMLGDFSAPWEGHARLAAALQLACYDRVVSIEMKRPESGLAGVAQAVRFARDCYGAT